MPTTVPDVDDGDIVSASWGDAVRLAVTELQAAPPAHGSTHQPGSADAIPTAVAGASAVGDTAATGASTSLSRADHRHSREAFGSPVASAVADTAADGSATTEARADHRHAREAFGSPVAVDTANAAGSATTVSRSGHKHALKGPAIQADSGASASLGAGSAADVTVTWSTAFADASYKVAIALAYNDGTNRTPPTGYLRLDGSNAPSASRIIVRVVNNSAVAEVVTVHAVAVHD